MRRLFPFLILLVLAACSRSTKKIEIDPAFGTYISGYTSGVISREAPIRIRFTQPYAGTIIELAALDEDYIDFSPSLDGELYWVNAYTLEFDPKEPLSSGEVFTAELDLEALYEVEEGFETFEFQFQTIQQNFSVYVDGLASYSSEKLERQYLEGSIVLADAADTTDVFQILRAEQEGRDLPIRYLPKSSTVIGFAVDSIVRTEAAGKVLLTWDGDPIDVDKEEEKTIEIPALGDFKVTQMRVVSAAEQYVEIRFSDPLQRQDLNGFILIEGQNSLRFVMEGNIVRIYPGSRMAGSKQVQIAAGIRNSRGYKTDEAYSKILSFEQAKPELKLVSNGVIMPNSGGLVFPFEAIGLSKVDLFVTRIFENNVLQFLQENDLDEDYRIQRVGRKVFQQTIDLTGFGKSDLHSWNRFHLDLSDLLQVEPGAIYQVELRFRKPYSLYPCAALEEESEDGFEAMSDTEDDGWGPLGSSRDGYWAYRYNWSQRNNPCHEAFYTPERASVRQNVVASDIGLIAKLGEDRILHVVANDLVTTEPISGADIEVFDYQQQVVTTIQTDGEGMAQAKLARRPFVVAASYKGQKGYLKLMDGVALSMGKFDVSGARVRNGLKGFLYGERGVWRPGDSLYLSFILEDKEDLLPAGHPLVMELYDPNGKLVQRNVQLEQTDGFYDFRTATDEDAPTGMYRAQIKAGNHQFQKYLRIETVKPNRLKIYLDFGGETLYSEDAFQGELELKWLHGAIADGLKAKIDLSLRKTYTAFPKFKGYVFDDPAREYSSESRTVFDERVDGAGKATIDLSDVSFRNAPGMLRASFLTKAFEPGGNFSIDHYSMDLSPYEAYVGIRTPKGTLWDNGLETDRDHEVEIVNVSEKGELLPSRNLEVQIYRIDWNWWWDSYSRNLADYIARNSVVPIRNQKITTSRGKASFTFRIDQPQYGRFFIRVTDPVSGHSTGKIVYMDWPYWARSNRVDSRNATMLGFSADKETYAVGETVKLTFPSSGEGRALVCVENGTKVIEKHWVETEDGETRFEFTAHEGMTPNIYVNIALLQPHDQAVNDRPIRSYGVIPLLVENPETHLEPEVKVPKVMRPETTAQVEVSEKQGKPMTYTLAIVDEGLLDLTRFRTPDPWKHFYAREALGVKTWDLYDYVMGAYGGELDKWMAVGGGGDLDAGQDRKANRFKPMVRFLGPFVLGAGEKVKHDIDIPNYIGSVRVMVVAGKDAAYGHTEKTVPVRKPLMVLATLPRVLSPGETIALPANVFAMESHVKDVQVDVQLDGKLFEADGPVRQQIRFSEVGDEVVNFRFKTREKIGVGKIRVSVRSGNETAYDEVEIQVRAPNPTVTRILDTVVLAGESWQTNLNYFGIQGTNEAVLELSSVPSLNLEQRLDYLIRYPHGCIEQTTSSGFPQLYLQRLLSLDNEQKIQIEQNVQAALNRLLHFQNGNGGLAYWPGYGNANTWGTSYAGHFMLEAEKQGYALPIDMKDRWIQFQQEQARSWGMNTSYNTYSQRYSQLDQAYRLYTLALARNAEMGAMNRLREMTGLSVAATWRLAAAYVLAGQPEVAERLIDQQPTRVQPYRELSYTYGSDTRDQAMILETLVLLKQQDKAAAVARDLAKKFGDGRWYSTQTTAYGLIAFATFAGQNGTERGMQGTYQVGNERGDLSTNASIWTFRTHDRKTDPGAPVSVRNTTQGPLYVRVFLRGIPLADDQTRHAENVSAQVRYLNLDGQEIDPAVLEQGTDFVSEVTVFNPGQRGTLKEMALSQWFPSGWEIINTRMGEVSENGGSAFTYQDIRDDRVFTYFDLEPKRKKVFRIQLNATYQGRFYLPGVYCEAMYDQSIHAKEPGQWVQVKSIE